MRELTRCVSLPLCISRGTVPVASSLPHATFSFVQNGTVKSNADLVKTLNDADVPGSDVVGKIKESEAACLTDGMPTSQLSLAGRLNTTIYHKLYPAGKSMWDHCMFLQRLWWPLLLCISQQSRMLCARILKLPPRIAGSSRAVLSLES